MSAIYTLTRWVAVLMLLCGIAVLADEQLDVAMKRLNTVKTFAFGGVGIAGMTSKGETDFKVVFSQPQPIALAAFEKLYATGNPQAKSYALFGIKKLSPNRFKELLKTAKASTDKVQVMRGCIISQESLREIAKQIDNDKFQL
jgi:hypothetical protein